MNEEKIRVQKQNFIKTLNETQSIFKEKYSLKMETEYYLEQHQEPLGMGMVEQYNIKQQKLLSSEF